MRKVLVFGTFDGVHRGHINFLKQSKKFGDELIVVVTRDANVKRQKGRRPARSEKIRLREIRKFADKSVLGERKITYKLIKKINPDVICVGYDQRPTVSQTRKILNRIGMRHVKIKKMKPYKSHKYKSSKLNELR
jgi:FAD synthetase